MFRIVEGCVVSLWTLGQSFLFFTSNRGVDWEKVLPEPEAADIEG